MLTRYLRRSCLCLALTVAASLAAQEISIARVYPGWRDAASFKRISEYFTGRENTGGATVLRTHPGERAGYYFLVRAINPGAPVSAQCLVSLILPTSRQLLTHTFATDLKSGDTVLHLGLTGADWTDPKANPVAWKIELTTADGRLLASEKSYLWDKPSGG